MRLRLNIVFGILCFLYSAVIVKALYIQHFNREPLLAYARKQYQKTVKEKLSRGNIFDRNNNPLAINLVHYNIGIQAKNRDKNLREQIKLISKIVPNISERQLWRTIGSRKKFTPLLKQVSLSEVQLKELKKLNRITVEQNISRYYPNNQLLAGVIGFIGNDKHGLSGIEKSLDKSLQGDYQTITYTKDAKGRPIKIERANDGRDGQDVQLSIDKEMQNNLESYLQEAVNHHQAQSAGAAVMDAVTGEILAMAQYPTFDPNHHHKYSNDKKKNIFITDPFEPGSTFKTFTVVAGLENKILTKNKKYDCEQGRLKVQNHYITEAEQRKKFEKLTVEEILAFSSNVGTTKIAFDIKYPLLRKTIEDFGFGELTGIELAGESKGIMPPAKKVKPLALSNISFGHAIATTGIQMLRAYAVFANGGHKIRPTLLKNSDSQLSDKNKILRSETVKAVNEMLVTAVETGTGTAAKVPHLLIAGKTGTAQRVSPTGGYQGYISSFIGYPVGIERPFVVYVYVDNPKKNGYYGNVVAAPVFQKITQNIIYKRKDFSLFAKSNSTVVNKQVDEVKTSTAHQRILHPGLTPTFVGLDKSSTAKIGQELNLKIETRGYGIVTDQQPSPGEPLPTDKVVILYFTPPKYEE